MRRAHLVIFTRRPAWGVGKRRLAEQAGELTALRFQRFAIGDILRRLGRDRRWRTWVAISPDRPAAWVRIGVPVRQGPGDLGARLARVIGALPPGPAVVIGSDAPDIRTLDIVAAFHALGANDAVFGPAPDGGFWLVGLKSRSLSATAFADVRWSSAFALADALFNLRGRRVTMLRSIEDVDDRASLERSKRAGKLLGRRRSSLGPAQKVLGDSFPPQARANLAPIGSGQGKVFLGGLAIVQARHCPALLAPTTMRRHQRRGPPSDGAGLDRVTLGRGR